MLRSRDQASGEGTTERTHWLGVDGSKDARAAVELLLVFGLPMKSMRRWYQSFRPCPLKRTRPLKSS